MQPLLAGGVFQLGMLYGGPATVVYGFILCFVFGAPMAISMAEIASPFVTAGVSRPLSALQSVLHRR